MSMLMDCAAPRETLQRQLLRFSYRYVAPMIGSATWLESPIRTETDTLLALPGDDADAGDLYLAASVQCIPVRVACMEHEITTECDGRLLFCHVEPMQNREFRLRPIELSAV